MQNVDKLVEFAEWVLSLRTGGLIEGKARSVLSEHNNPQKGSVVQANMELVRLWIADASPDELRTLRSIINGKLSKRKITPEQQAKMQAARRKLPQTLQDFGWDDGRYWQRCQDCGEEHIAAKRASRCKPCAERLLAQATGKEPAPE